MNYYQEYLEFVKNYDLNKDRHVIENKYCDEYNIDDADLYYLEAFLEPKYFKNHSENFGYFEMDKEIYFDRSINFIEHFPLNIILKLIERYYTFYNIGTCSQIEIVKYLFAIWHNENCPEQVKYWIQKITNHLTTVANMDKHQYDEMVHNSYYDKTMFKFTGILYYTWWLYVFYPLLENCTELILKLMKIAYICDAQDMLMYGIYQMSPNKLKSFMKDFIVVVNNSYNEQHRGFNLLESCTGSFQQLKRIISKLSKNGYNFFDDPSLQWFADEFKKYEHQV